MNKVEIKGKKSLFIDVASCISEMTTKQYIAFVTLLLQLYDQAISFERFKVDLIKKLIHLKVNFGFYFLSKEEKEDIFSKIYLLSHLVESFFKDENGEDGIKKVAQLSFVKQLIPKIGRYYGPADGLNDVTFCEYRVAHDHFLSYVNSNDPAELDQMIAVLYRPRKLLFFARKWFPGYDGQHRIRFTSKSNPFLLNERVKKISRLPWSVRYGIFLWFAGCEEYLVSGKPEINGREIDFSLLYEKKGDDGKSLSDIGLVGILYSLSETKVFGSIEETDNQNLYDVMLRLYQVVVQMKERESKYGTVK